MEDIAIKEVLSKLPKQELETSMETYIRPMTEKVRDERLQRVIPLAIEGILGSESPVITHMAQIVARTTSGVWAAAKRMYRFLENKRFSHRELAQGLYEISRASVNEEKPAYAVAPLIR